MGVVTGKEVMASNSSCLLRKSSLWFLEGWNVLSANA